MKKVNIEINVNMPNIDAYRDGYKEWEKYIALEILNTLTKIFPKVGNGPGDIEIGVNIKNAAQETIK